MQPNEPSARRSGAVLAATKLHIPAARPGLVARQELVDRLVAGAPGKLTLIGAPPGYGKTTLLAEWHSSPREERAFAWLSLDEGDNDPARFWTGVIDALRTVKDDFGEVTLGALQARGIDLVDTALPLLVNELSELPRDVVLVLDDYQFVREAEVHRSVSSLLEHLPQTLHVALATRVDPALPLARMRARGELREIRARELRLSDQEAAALLQNAVGAELDPGAVVRLQERTEGWAAGLYLAALSIRGRDDSREFIETFAGDDRHVVDYLSAEVLSGQPVALREFLLRTSILDRLCGPLCDAVLGTERSDRVLEQIERGNLFLVSLDTTRTWYRYHHLFGELLLHELELSEPGAVEDLHRRASDWYRAEGSVPEAIRHAAAARDYHGARELIARHWSDYFNQGRLGTVSQWLEAIPESTLNEDPRLRVAWAWLALDRGRLEDARRSIQIASEASAPAVEGPDSVGADIEVLRAVHGFKVGELSNASTAASRVLEVTNEETDPFPHTVAHLIIGVTRYWSGELEGSSHALDEAARLAREGNNDLGHSYALGYLGLIAGERGELEDADRLGSVATGLSKAPGFVEHFVPMIGHLARGRAAKLDGRLDDAERAIGRAEELSRRGAGRLEAASSLVALAEVRQLRGHSEAAGALLDEAHDVLDRCPEPGTVAGALEAAERGLRAARRGAATRAERREELTDRELAVLRLLDSEMSRREIADALYVTPNTVKTHLRGIYRKLDASTREEAVGRARESGLL